MKQLAIRRPLAQPAAMQANAIAETLDLVAARVGDPAPLVFARLFALYPEMEPLFVSDTSGAVRGPVLRLRAASTALRLGRPGRRPALPCPPVPMVAS